MILYVIISMIFGLMRLESSDTRNCYSIYRIFQRISLLVQLFWAYYVLPFFGISLEIYSRSSGFGLNFGAYGKEIVRAGILQFLRDNGRQHFFKFYFELKRIKRIIIPQIFPIILPLVQI